MLILVQYLEMFFEKLVGIEKQVIKIHGHRT
jgi:hypothetical protein